jgi:Uma2 family endonuclease
MSPAEYLSTSFENPDREYVHGEIVERGTPDYPHGRMQVELGFRFVELRDTHRLFVCFSTRMRLVSDLYRTLTAEPRASASGPDVPAGHKVTKYC